MSTKQDLLKRWKQLKLLDSASGDERRKRGFALEKLLFELFVLEGLNPSPSYRGIGEQIDSLIEFHGRYFMIKIGFIVEGKTDAEIILRLVKQLHPTLFARAIHIGGKSRFYGAHATAVAFLQKDYQHVFVLFDADTMDLAQVNDQLHRFREPFREYELETVTTLFAVVPQIEAWLLSSFTNVVNEPNTDLKQALQQLATLSNQPMKVIRAVDELDLMQMKRNNNNFAVFCKQLDQVVNSIKASQKSGLALAG